MVFLEVFWGYLPFLGLFVDGILKQSRLRHIPLFEMFKGGNESSPKFVRLLTREKIAVFEQLICDIVAFHRGFLGLVRRVVAYSDRGSLISIVLLKISLGYCLWTFLSLLSFFFLWKTGENLEHSFRTDLRRHKMFWAEQFLHRSFTVVDFSVHISKERVRAKVRARTTSLRSYESRGILADLVIKANKSSDVCIWYGASTNKVITLR